MCLAASTISSIAWCRSCNAANCSAASTRAGRCARTWACRGRRTGSSHAHDAMSIRAKFFALAGILLLLFGAVVGLLTLLQDATAHKLEDIVYHHQPLRRALADLDVDTFEYELRIDRLLLRPESARPICRPKLPKSNRWELGFGRTLTRL